MARLKFWSLPLAPASSDRRASDAAIPPRILDFVEQIDALGFDEFWCGEHHSSGWGNDRPRPEMFSSGRQPARRTKADKTRHRAWLSLPYHHPFNVAQRMVQLDPHDRAARAIFWVRSWGALPPTRTHASASIPMTQRDPPGTRRSASSARLFNGERVHREKSDWFTMNDGGAAAFSRCRKRMPFVGGVADFALGHDAGRQNTAIGIISLGLDVDARIDGAADAMGDLRKTPPRRPAPTVSRSNWRVLLSWHIAETPRGRRGAKAGEGTDALAQRNIMSAPCRRPGLQPIHLARGRRGKKPPGGEAAALDHRHAGRSGEDDQET